MLPTLKISNKITIQGEFYIIKSYNVFSHNNDFYYEYCLKTGNNEIAYLADLSQIDKEIGVIFYKETNKIDTTEKPTFEVEEILLKSVSDKQIFSRKRFNCDYYKNNEEILIIKANFITINDRDFYTGLKFESQYSYKEESRFRQKSTSKKYYYKGIVLNDINSIKINESNNLNFDDLNTYNNRPIKDKLFDLKSIDDLKIGSEFYINGERLILIGINEQLFDYNINPRQIKEYNFSDVSFTNFFKIIKDYNKLYYLTLSNKVFNIDEKSFFKNYYINLLGVVINQYYKFCDNRDFFIVKNKDNEQFVYKKELINLFDIKTVKKGNIIQPPNVENEIEQKNDKKNLKIALFCAILAVIVSIIFYIFISNNPKEFTFKYSDVNNELVYLKKIESTNDVVNYSNKLKKIKVNKLGFPEYVSPLSSMFFENQNEMLNVLSKLFDIIDNVYLLEITDTQYKYHIYSSVSKTESKIEDYFNELVKYRETKNIKPHNFSVVENKTKFALVNFNDFEIKISDNSTDNVHQCIIEISHVTNSENIK